MTTDFKDFKQADLLNEARNQAAVYKTLQIKKVRPASIAVSAMDLSEDTLVLTIDEVAYSCNRGAIYNLFQIFGLPYGYFKKLGPDDQAGILLMREFALAEDLINVFVAPDLKEIFGIGVERAADYYFPKVLKEALAFFSEPFKLVNFSASGTQFLRFINSDYKMEWAGGIYYWGLDLLNVDFGSKPLIKLSDVVFRVDCSNSVVRSLSGEVLATVHKFSEVEQAIPMGMRNALVKVLHLYKTFNPPNYKMNEEDCVLFLRRVVPSVVAEEAVVGKSENTLSGMLYAVTQSLQTHYPDPARRQIYEAKLGMALNRFLQEVSIGSRE